MCGRLATDIARYLQGKHKPIYTPQIGDCGDNVCVFNTSLIKFNKTTWNNKKYYTHSQYPGGLKEKTIKVLGFLFLESF